MPRKVGRPTKLTPEVQSLIVEALKTGAHITTAAYHAKVHPDTVWKWLKLGKDDLDGPFGEFRRITMGAIHEAELRFVAIVANSAQANPEHAKWMLTHRHPERWAERSRHMISGTDGGPVRTEEVGLTKLVEEFTRIADHDQEEVVPVGKKSP